MIIFTIFYLLIIATIAFDEAMIYEGKKWDSFKWDEHTFYMFQRAFIFVVMIAATTLNFVDGYQAIMPVLLMFMFVHNGVFYEIRKRIDIANNNVPDYPKGFFDTTKTPYRLFGIRLSFPFYIRLILFILGIVSIILIKLI